MKKLSKIFSMLVMFVVIVGGAYQVMSWIMDFAYWTSKKTISIIDEMNERRHKKSFSVNDSFDEE